MPHMRIGTLQWAVGIFCVITGALMLVAPHQFRVPEYFALRYYLPWWGGLMILAGAGLVASAALKNPGRAALLGHLIASAALLMLAAGLAMAGIWTGTVSYGTLATALLLASLWSARGPLSAPAEKGIELFAVAIGSGVAINGLLFLALPGLFDAPFYSLSRPLLGYYGAAFLLAGGATLVSRLRTGTSPRVVKLCGLLLPLALYSFGLPNLGRATWTGVAYYGGFGVLVAILPWLEPRLRRVDLSSLQARLALSLSVAVTVPLLLITAVGMDYIERQAMEQALRHQRSEASALAQKIGERVGHHRALLEALAGEYGLADMPVNARVGLLERIYSGDPNGAGFLLLDAAGKEVARGGDLSGTLDGGVGGPPSGETAPWRAASLLALPPPSGGTTTAQFRVALQDHAGEPAGFLVSGIDISRLAGDVGRLDPETRSELSLLDIGTGRVLARSAPGRTGEDGPLASPPMAALAAGDGEAAAMEYPSGIGEWVAGYARVPGFDWGVVLQQPRDAALAGLATGRDLAFLTLLLSVALGMVVGATAAGFLIAPLNALARATEGLGAGDFEAPLPESRITQVRRLATVFGEMRDRLLAQAAERERAEDAQRFLAEASDLLSSSLDYETTLNSIARMAVPRLADWCSVIVVEQEGGPRRVAVAHGDPEKERLLRGLYVLYPPEMGERHPVAVVMRTGEPWIMEEVPEGAMHRSARFPHLFDTMRELMLNSCMVVPLKTRDRVMGAILLCFGPSGRRYRPADLALAQDLARRCALAIENSRLYQEAQQAIGARDEFLSVAAHELKTPMTSLRGFVQTILRQLQKEGVADPVRLRRALEVIDRQSDKLSQLVVQLLDVARIESGRLILYRERVELSDLVAGVVAGAQASTTKHNLVFRTPPSLWVMADPLRLEQVVSNLVNNAIKYSPEGGDVEVELAAEGPKMVRLSVRDHGIGIPPEYQHRVFDRFYRIDDGGYPGGMGLGLFITRQIVELHGGSIVVETPPDGGTRFLVSLPAEGEG